jgi:signal transduction histidine kinase
MRLSEFIRQNHDRIGEAWEQFARVLTPFAKGLALPSLRDHLDDILDALADDMTTPEDAAQQASKEKGEQQPGAVEWFTDRHAQMRLKQGFNLRHVIAEYRALRASILTLYAQSLGVEPDVGEIVRFNEALDQGIAAILQYHESSVTQYTTRFLAILAHDIRNPLNVINLAAAGLERQAPGNAVDRIKRGVRQANRMVDDLAIFVRQRTGSALPLSKSPTDLRLLCEQALESTRAQHADKSFNLTAQGDLRGVWDSDRLLQVINNLLSNAAIHGAGPQIGIEIRSEGAEVVIEVTSQGNPIPAEQLESIFEPMVRAAGTSETLFGGLGMGLFIVREIVSAHGGSVAVRSSLNDGTTFAVRLPR